MSNTHTDNEELAKTEVIILNLLQSHSTYDPQVYATDDHYAAARIAHHIHEHFELKKRAPTPRAVVQGGELTVEATLQQDTLELGPLADDEGVAPTKSSGELEEILRGFGKDYEWPYQFMRDRNRSPADQQQEAQAELLAETVATIDALHTTQTTKLQAEADTEKINAHLEGRKVVIDAIKKFPLIDGKSYLVDKQFVKHLEREHKIGEDRE